MMRRRARHGCRLQRCISPARLDRRGSYTDRTKLAGWPTSGCTWRAAQLLRFSPWRTGVACGSIAGPRCMRAWRVGRRVSPRAERIARRRWAGALSCPKLGTWTTT